MLTNISFEPSTHTYTVGGVVFPSVTEILKNTIIPYIPYKGTDKMDLGTKVHLTTEYYDRGELDFETLHPILKGYLDGWIKFIEDYKVKILEIERILAHKLYRYAGTVDRVVEIGTQEFIIDIKTGNEYAWHPIQLEGYKFLLKDNGHKIENTACVYLSQEGSYKYVKHDSYNLFLSCLSIYNFKKVNKLLIKN